MKSALPVLAFLLLLVHSPARAQAPAQSPAAPAPAAQGTAQAPAPKPGPFMFRNFIWGVSKQDVRQYEKAKFYKEEGDTLYFVERPDKFRRLIRYDFEGGRLVRARSEFVELHYPNNASIINLAYEEQKKLSEIYGEPRSEFFWKNRQYENYPAYWGRAMYREDLQIRFVWDLPEARVTMLNYYDGLYYQLITTAEAPAARSGATGAIPPGTAPSAIVAPPRP